MKPKYIIDLKKDDHPFKMLIRAGSILKANGLRKEAREIWIEAAPSNFEFHKVLRLLKKYFEI